ncbi:FAD-dependent oxidoreductase [Ornithinibacillus halotolerans]|uniref:NADH:ubiquinone reductase (non-electrogenic) n=1 Tax=Ornithinibacillus halotolerans TaxID=1274357 RepID=A0A916S5B4_9BACI|nr:FAD-dependent oxidoreductase [Ornithinibacillus halotolerans]GGA85205.1 hypothetical protein GCM10008025_30300 [Ornithinibacillus halotolerans]
MSTLTCIIIGGGYAGIHAIRSIQRRMGQTVRLRIILVDPSPYHVQKVLLFKPAAIKNSTIKIPWKKIFPTNLKVIQGAVTSINHVDKVIHLKETSDEDNTLAYDIAVVAVGSVFQSVDSNKGGIPLISAEHGNKIYIPYNKEMLTNYSHYYLMKLRFTQTVEARFQQPFDQYILPKWSFVS